MPVRWSYPMVLFECQIDCDDILHRLDILQIELDFSGGQIVVNFFVLIYRQVFEFVVFELQTDALVTGIVLNDFSALEVILRVIAENLLERAADAVDCRSDDFV